MIAHYIKSIKEIYIVTIEKKENFFVNDKHNGLRYLVPKTGATSASSGLTQHIQEPEHKHRDRHEWKRNIPEPKTCYQKANTRVSLKNTPTAPQLPKPLQRPEMKP